MTEEVDYKKISFECLQCKAKFDIWLSTINFDSETEENIKKNFFQHCPVCKALECGKDK